MRHLLNVVGTCSIFMCLVGMGGLGVHFTASLLLGLLLSLLIGTLTVVASTFCLVAIRAAFNLERAGYIVQLPVTWLIGAASIAITGLLFKSMVVGSSLLASAIVVVLTLSFAALTGQTGKRSWLPSRRKSSN